MHPFMINCSLQQQTPMIHFQHDEENACLRASEVKPKLDRFLLKLLGGGEENAYENGFRVAGKRGWLLGDGKHPALAYKMRISAHCKPLTSTDAEDQLDFLRQKDLWERQRATSKKPRRKPSKIARSYFGNMVSQEDIKKYCQQESIDSLWDATVAVTREKYRETVFYPHPNSISLTILCFLPELSRHIREHLHGFFLMHNFGTRQNKGFGSFLLTNMDGTRTDANCQAIIEKHFNGPFYRMEYGDFQWDTKLDDIWTLYQLMKSGLNDGRGRYERSRLFSYFHHQRDPLGNEKAWMKLSGIGLIRRKPGTPNRGWHREQQDNKKFRYTRALLGVGDSVTFLNSKGLLDPRDNPSPGGKPHLVSIAPENKNIERFPSPILFKVIQNNVFILPFEPNQNILKQNFSFSSHAKPETIRTPSEFSMKAFMEYFVNYVNDPTKQEELRQDGRIHFKGPIKPVGREEVL